MNVEATNTLLLVYIFFIVFAIGVIVMVYTGGIDRKREEERERGMRKHKRG